MRDVKDYLRLPYTTTLRRDEEDDFVARIEELPGCTAHGKTQQEALDNLEEVKELWIRERVENGEPVPEPVAEEVLPSGKWVQRVPRTLHKKLVALAKQDNTSLNQLVTSILSEAVGLRSPKEAPTEKLEVSTGDIWNQVWSKSHTGELNFFHYVSPEPVPLSPHRSLKISNALHYLAAVYSERVVFEEKHEKREARRAAKGRELRGVSP